VYAANFPDDPRGPLRENIEHLTAARLDHPDLAADAWTLSPPCQPYTRRGKRLGPDDPRAAAFAHLLRLLPTLKNPPDRVFVENVVGFERSATRDALVDALERAGYEWRERRRASPSDAGVPYVRDRYYLLAKKRGLGFRDSGGAEADSDPVGGGALAAPADAFAFSRNPCQKRGSTVGAYLDPASASDASLAVRGATVLKYREWLDVVAPSSATCQCFTSGYGRTVFGGSVLASEAFARRYCVPVVEKDGGPAFEGRFRVRRDFAAEAAEAAERGGEGAKGLGCSHEEDEDEDVWLRYFSPREIANLHGLDERFALPEALTRRQLYRVLGNSVSVDVVAELLGHLFDDADERRE
jgi:tRNA (cytosine38-C5)-methyltransferase